MQNAGEYLKRVMVLGDYCYLESAKKTVLTVFGCIKVFLSERDIHRVNSILPEELQSLWQVSEIRREENNTSSEDCIGLLQRAGNYPYRAAAEKAIKVVFASLKEVLTADGLKEFVSLIPSSLREIFNSSGVCVFDSSAEEFL